MNNKWRHKRIGDLGRIVTGKTPSSSRPKCFGDEYPFVTPTDMHDKRYASVTERFLSQEGAESQKTLLIPAGAVCVSCIGWQMGKAIVTSRPSFTNQQLHSIIPSSDVNPLFLYYSLSTRREEFLSLGSAGGVRTPIINKSVFSDLKVLMADLSLQHKIAGVLSAYDDLIENNTRRIAILEEMAQAIYREWFVNFRFPGHDKVKLITSPLGKIPEGWKPLRLGDMAKEVRRGVDPSQVAPDTPYIGLEHLPRRSITLGEWGKAADVQSTKLAFRKGEILFGKIRPYFHKVGVAPVDGVCSSDAIVIVPTSASAFGPVVCCVSSDDFVRHATQTSQGTKMPRANWDVLVKYPLPIPPDDLLNHFNETISDVVGTLRLLMMKNRNLRATRDLLLPKLINGQLDVEELDIETGKPLVEATAE
ncbi:MAG: restriction endonuclease subunit S [Planctomycetota bacterium]|nr:restriction endonuclease subunit S [Planctomycetota bacterium]